MSMAEESRQAKMISEMRGFIKKVLMDPTIPVKCMEIARRLHQEKDAERKIADEISASTTIRIPENMSDADKLFLDVVNEVLEDESALY
ncbi:hypothetical protein HCH_00885 [Hahella chejuensis KCTC 2396]|uniref:Uncharacterized protein n=1 Tax=Hahella chejuensis (strain KCTC 2396) TaxID=349521 RepID=Q2SNJ7_HAHCH|nr:hypothetical protein [Hahella chejuensis]ABC27777.1 hypothetical protein HCH_00885 [Hahella chejuensis KCTC 2396]